MYRRRFIYHREVITPKEWGFTAIFEGGYDNTRILGEEFVATVGLPYKMTVNGYDVEPTAVRSFAGMYQEVSVECLFLNDPTTMAHLFHDCSRLLSVSFGFNVYPEGITDMSYMFYGCNKLTNVELANMTNTPNLTNMAYMFYDCRAMTAMPTYLWDMDTSHVTNMSYMFWQCNSLTSARLGNTDSVRNIDFIFAECSAITSFNKGNSDIRNVSSLGAVFRGCSNITSLDLRGWNTGGVHYMAQTFYGCSKLSTIQVSGNLSQVSYFQYTFDGVAPNGAFVGNSAYNYDNIAAQLPSGWSVYLTNY